MTAAPRLPHLDPLRLTAAARLFLGLEVAGRTSFARLLGVPEDSRDPAAIDAGWEARLRQVRKFQIGKHAELTQDFMNYLTQVRTFVLARAREGQAAGECFLPEGELVPLDLVPEEANQAELETLAAHDPIVPTRTPLPQPVRPNLTPPNLASPNLASPNLASPNLTPPNLTPPPVVPLPFAPKPGAPKPVAMSPVAPMPVTPKHISAVPVGTSAVSANPGAAAPINTLPVGTLPAGTLPVAPATFAPEPADGGSRPFAWGVFGAAASAVLVLAGLGYLLLPSSPAVLEVAVDQAGAEVWVDGLQARTVPRAGHTIVLTRPGGGTHVVSVRKPDFVDFDHDWTTLAGEHRKLSVNLVPIPPATATPAVPAMSFPVEPRRTEESPAPAETGRGPAPPPYVPPGVASTSPPLPVATSPPAIASTSSLPAMPSPHVPRQPRSVAPRGSAPAALLAVARGDWSREGDELVQSGGEWGSHLIFGDPTWTDYTLDVEARKDSGREGFLIAFRATDAVRFEQCVFGGEGNTHHIVQSHPVYYITARSTQLLPIPTGNWLRIRVRVQGDRVQAWLDDRLVLEGPHRGAPQGAIGLGSWATTCRFRNLRVTAPDGRVLCDGLPRLEDRMRRDVPSTPASPRPPGTVDLLDLVHTRHDAGRTPWWFEGRDLRSPGRGGAAPLTLPYVVPPHYALRLKVERLSAGNSGLFVGLPTAGKHVMANLDFLTGGVRRSGLDMVVNPAATVPPQPADPLLPVGRTAEVECIVSPTGIRLLCDGREMAQSPPNNRPTAPQGRFAGRTDLPFLAVLDGGDFRIRDITLTELEGTGRRLYPADSEPEQLDWKITYFAWPKGSSQFDWRTIFRSPAQGTAVQPALRANWFQIAPHPDLQPNFWALTAVSDVDLPAGRYEFRVSSDDGMRLRVDGTTILEEWTGHDALCRSTEVDLPAGPHRIEVDYFQADQLASLDVSVRRAMPAAEPNPLSAHHFRYTQDTASYAEILAGLGPDWTCKQANSMAWQPEYAGRRGVLRTHPVDQNNPAILVKTATLPKGRRSRLVLDVAHHLDGRIVGDWRLVVRCNGTELHSSVVTGGLAPQWRQVVVDLSRYAGQTVELLLEGHAVGWNNEFANWGRIEVRSE